MHALLSFFKKNSLIVDKRIYTYPVEIFCWNYYNYHMHLNIQKRYRIKFINHLQNMHALILLLIRLLDI